MIKMAPQNNEGKIDCLIIVWGELVRFLERKKMGSLPNTTTNPRCVLPGTVATNYVWLFNFKLNEMKHFSPLVALVTFHTFHCHCSPAATN